MQGTARTAAIAAGGILAVIVTAFLVVTTLRADQVLDGVSVADLDLGGLDREAAREELDAYAERRSADLVVLTLGQREFGVDPVALGAALDTESLLDEALDAGRDGSFIGDRLATLTGTDVTIPAPLRVDDDAIRARVGEIATEVALEPNFGAVAIDPVTLAVEVESPADGLEVRVDATVDLVAEALREPGPDTLELPTRVLPSRTDAEDAAAAAAAAERAVAGDLTLVTDDGEVVLAPREIAPLISATVSGSEQDASLALTVSSDAVAQHVVPVAAPLLREPRDASFDAPRSPSTRYDDQDDAVWRPVPATVTVVPGRNGTEFDVELVADQLTAAVRAGERRVPLRLPEVPPALTTAQAEEFGIDTMLSTFTTYHDCCQERVTNIQRLATMVDDTTVMPGQQFSINQISGVRECSKGFAPAGMILNGEIVDSCGGGVSQFGTTTVNAVFFAGLDPDAYKPHSFYISRYPMAREATLNYPSPDIDVRFTNDTGAPVIVRTTFTDTSITVTFYGRSDVSEVRATLGSIANVKPYRTERRVDRTLPAGATRTVQSGLDGFRIGLTRTVTRTDGSSETDDWSNTYVAKTEIIEFNPDAPKPDPEPTPDPTPEPKPGPSSGHDPSPGPSDD